MSSKSTKKQTKVILTEVSYNHFFMLSSTIFEPTFIFSD
ncbi:hypothetical protein AQPE_4964 [Aquipluma nitroreducens]|uniref:Uncharacterized protein n=1 Tax=Aquipluma nitroreducens TaxID=2010828 RepID=A0A5K7SGL7_9BACT|nr:hypothetical protein AQPE_4964 [Aquipluma nitroreducens]